MTLDGLHGATPVTPRVSIIAGIASGVPACTVFDGNFFVPILISKLSKSDFPGTIMGL